MFKTANAFSTFAGLQLEGQSLHQEALMAFSFALSINPDYVPSMVSMAGILRNLGGNGTRYQSQELSCATPSV